MPPHLQRLSPAENTRMHELMDRNNDGLLAKSERLELKRLGLKVDEMMLENAKRLARAARPELFDENGEPIKRLFRAALKADADKRRR